MLNTSIQFNNKPSLEETDIDNHIQLIPNDLQTSTKEGRFFYFHMKILLLLY